MSNTRCSYPFPFFLAMTENVRTGRKRTRTDVWHRKNLMQACEDDTGHLSDVGDSDDACESEPFVEDGCDEDSDADSLEYGVRVHDEEDIDVRENPPVVLCEDGEDVLTRKSVVLRQGDDAQGACRLFPEDDSCLSDYYV